MRIHKPLLAILALLAAVPLLSAQPQPEAQDASAQSAAGSDSWVPIELSVSLTRYRGEQKLEALPYTLALVAEGQYARSAKVRMGVEVPVRVKGSGDVQYRDVGNNIDCEERHAGGGSYVVTCTVEQSSVYRPATSSSTDAPESFGSVPVFRSFRVAAAGVLRDGQTRSFTSATDPVSGEVLKVDVTLHVVR